MDVRPTVLRALSVVVWALGALLPLGTGASAATAHRVFYLDLRAGQCAQGATPGSKHILVVSCNNASHNMEVYAVTHEPWTAATRPPDAVVVAEGKRICLVLFAQKFKGALRAPYGYIFYFADAGAETAKYGSRAVCTLVRWPRFGVMGSGTHFHQAA